MNETNPSPTCSTNNRIPSTSNDCYNNRTTTAEADDIVCSDQIRHRKIRPQNIVCRIIARERGPQRLGTDVHVIREFYKNIYPNLTIINVEKPPGFLRKFSIDGKYLIAFTYDQTSLEIYEFKGVFAAAHLLYSWKTELVPNSNFGLPYLIRNHIFESLFKV